MYKKYVHSLQKKSSQFLGRHKNKYNGWVNKRQITTCIHKTLKSQRKLYKMWNERNVNNIRTGLERHNNTHINGSHTKAIYNCFNILTFMRAPKFRCEVFSIQKSVPFSYSFLWLMTMIQFPSWMEKECVKCNWSSVM